MNALVCIQMFYLGRIAADYALRAAFASPNFSTYKHQMWLEFSAEVQVAAFALAEAGGEAEQELALGRIRDLSRRVATATGDLQLEEVVRRLTLVAV